ncbi:MAG: hypothetical protein WCA98_14985 [Candidatus Acidiferrales bacterium]
MRQIEKAVCILAFCALVPAYWINFRAPAVGLYHDDGVYIVTAKALAEGKGYRIVSLPDEIPQTKYPPVFPLILAGVWSVAPRFPQNIPLLKLIPLLSEVVWLYLVALFVRKKSRSLRLACWIAFLTAAAPAVLYMSVVPLSEMTFACLCTGSLLVLLDIEDHPDTSTKKLLFASALAAAAILTRTAGFPLILAGACTLFLRKRVPEALKFLVVASLLVSPWVWWTRTHQPPGSLYDYYSQANYASWNLVRHFTWPQKAIIFKSNILASLLAPGSLLGMTVASPGFMILILLIGGFVLYGWLLDFRGGLSALNIFLILYAAVIVLWAWPPSRFYIPVLPFLLLYGYMGADRFLRGLLLLRPQSRVSGWVCLLVLVPCATHGLILQARGALRTKAAALPYITFGDWDSLTSVSNWISQETPADAVVMTNLDPLMFLSTGRKAVRGFIADPFEVWYAASPQDPLGSQSQMVDLMLRGGVDYFARTSTDGFRELIFLNAFVDRLAVEHPEAVKLMETASDPNYRVYAIDRVKLAAAFGKDSGRR